MLKTSSVLEKRCNNLRAILEELDGQMQVVPAEIATLKMEEIGSIIIQLKELHDILKGGLKAVNTVLVPAEDALCRKILNDTDDITYKHPEATLTASARGFFEVKDPEGLLKYLDGNLELFCKLINSKSERTDYFEAMLNDGQKIPKCVSTHMLTSIRMRKNGKTEE